jgi:hypothetical protein
MEPAKAVILSAMRNWKSALRFVHWSTTAGWCTACGSQFGHGWATARWLTRGPKYHAGITRASVTLKQNTPDS